MNISYPGFTLERENQYLTPSQTSSVPAITFTSLDPENNYTLIMYDPDASHLHWLKTNITTKNINGETLVPYKGPSPPPPASSLHHYVFSLFEQREKENENANKKESKGRLQNRKIDFHTLLSLLDLEMSNKREKDTKTFVSHFIGGRSLKQKKRKKSRISETKVSETKVSETRINQKSINKVRRRKTMKKRKRKTKQV